MDSQSDNTAAARRYRRIDYRRLRVRIIPQALRGLYTCTTCGHITFDVCHAARCARVATFVKEREQRRHYRHIAERRRAKRALAEREKLCKERAALASYPVGDPPSPTENNCKTARAQRAFVARNDKRTRVRQRTTTVVYVDRRGIVRGLPPENRMRIGGLECIQHATQVKLSGLEGHILYAARGARITRKHVGICLVPTTFGKRRKDNKQSRKELVRDVKFALRDVAHKSIEILRDDHYFPHGVGFRIVCQHYTDYERIANIFRLPDWEIWHE